MTGNEENARKQIISELEKRLEITKSALLNVLDEWFYYQDIIQPQILFDYERHFGDIEFELQNKKREIQELDRRTELISQKITRGEKITEYSLKIVDLIIKKEFNRKERLENRESYRSKTTNYGTASYSEPNPNRNNGFKFTSSANRTNCNHDSGYNFQFTGNNNQSSYYTNNYKYNSSQSKPQAQGYRSDWRDYLDEMQIPHLYRSIVKKIHPDLKGETDHFKKYWHNVQDAYRTKNAGRLKLFFLALCIDEDKFYSSLQEKEYDMRRMINEFERKLSEEQSKLNSMKMEEPFVLLDKLKDRLWIAKRKRFLRDKLFQINNQISIKEIQLKRISCTNTQKPVVFSNSYINKRVNTNI